MYIISRSEERNQLEIQIQYSNMCDSMCHAFSFAYLVMVPNGHYLIQKENKIIWKFYSTGTLIIHLSPSGLSVSIYLKISREKEM